MKYICDTNFILRYLLADNPEMFSKAKEIFNEVHAGESTIILEQAVFTEVIFVLSSFYKVPKAKIAQILSELLAYKGIKSSEKGALSLALAYYNKFNLHIVDCLVLAKAKISGQSMLTFDRKLLSYL